MRKSVKIMLIILAVLVVVVTAGSLLVRSWLGKTHYTKDEDVVVNQDAYRGNALTGAEAESAAEEEASTESAAKEETAAESRITEMAEEAVAEAESTAEEETAAETGRACKAEGISEAQSTQKAEGTAEAAGAAETEGISEAAGAAETEGIPEAANAAETEGISEAAGAAETEGISEAAGAAEAEGISEAAGTAETEGISEAANAAETEGISETQTIPGEAVTGKMPDSQEQAASGQENAGGYDLSGVVPLTGDQVKNTYTLLVIGGPSLSKEDDPASRTDADAVIIMTIDHNRKESMFYSFDTDLYVEIPGFGGGRLGNAYAVGGGPLLLQTMEENYGLHIDNYASISFRDVARIMEMPEFENMNISKEGLDVVKRLVYSLGALKPTEITSYISQLMPYVTHNLDGEQMLKIILQIPRIIPYYGVDGMIPGEVPVREQNGCLVPDPQVMSAYLKQKLYGLSEGESLTEKADGLSEREELTEK